MGSSKKPHRSLTDRLLRHPKSEKTVEKAGYESYTDFVKEDDKPQPAVLEPDPNEPSLWKRAWEQVRKEIRKEDKAWEPPPELALDTPTKDEVGRVREAAQKRAEAAEDGGSKIPGTERTYREVYGKVANWADKFTFVGDLVVQADPGYATIPWAFVRFAITTFSREDATWHTLLEGIGLISELIPQYMVIEQTYAQIDSDLSDALVRELLAFYVKILHFQIRAIDHLNPKQSGWRFLQRLNPITDEDIKQERAAIDKARQRVDHDISLVHYDATKRGIEGLQTGQGDILSALLDLMSSMRTQFNEADSRQKERNEAILEMWKEPLDALMTHLDDERQRKELLEIRKWLSMAKPEEDYDDAKEKRPMPLGDWIFHQQNFVIWEASVRKETNLLWLHGFTGTGKTGLASSVIDHLREKAGKGDSTQLAFFYCSNDRVDSGWNSSFDRSDPEEILRSLVSQLAVSQRGKTASPLAKDKYAAFGPRSDKYRQPNYADCVDILLSISRFKPITIVLDGLNECDQNKAPTLIQHFKTLVAASRWPLKILISTRLFPAIEREIVPELSIEVNTENNGQDVNSFVKKTLRARIKNGDLLNGKPVPPDLVQKIEDTLIRRAQNMFLYASLLLDRLCDRSRNDNEVSIRRKLEELPNSLADGYNRIMEEVHDDKNNSRRSCDIAQHTFKWLLLVQQPLEFASLVEAVSPPESKTDVNEILSACRSLVVKPKERVIFEFAHYSVREHISKMAEYSPSQCHLVIAKSCLRNLNTWYAAESQKSDVADSQKFLSRYAKLYWPIHFEGIKKEDIEEHRALINNLLRGFLLQRRKTKDRNGYSVYAEWFAEARGRVKLFQDDHHLVSKLDDLEASPATPLFAACVFGLEDIIGKFGRELDGLNKRNIRGQTAICLAIKNNKFDVVKALLSRRFPAEVNLLNVKAVQQYGEFDANKAPSEIIFASALQCAAATGRREIAGYLIEKGAHIDLVAGYYGSPLQAAALHGHRDIVTLLLKHGAEPNSQGGYYGMSAFPS